MDMTDDARVDLTAIPGNILVRDLDFPTRTKICRKLDVPRPLGDDCRALADKVGMSKDQIDLLWLGQGAGNNCNPTENVLSWWGTRNDATLGQLIEFLEEIGRMDVVKIICQTYPQGSLKLL